VSAFNEAAPEAAARHRHMLAPGLPQPCDVCKREVVGPMAR
jgi:hypothetical protein